VGVQTKTTDMQIAWFLNVSVSKFSQVSCFGSPEQSSGNSIIEAEKQRQYTTNNFFVSEISHIYNYLLKQENEI
jgi:hypothetical protein